MYIVCRLKRNLHNFMLGNKELICDFGLRAVKNDTLSNFLIIRKPALRRFLFPRKKEQKGGGVGEGKKKTRQACPLGKQLSNFACKGVTFCLS